MDWANALVSGNGTLGAMVFGQPLDETIILNHARPFMPLHEPLLFPPHKYLSALHKSPFGYTNRAPGGCTWQPRAGDVRSEGGSAKSPISSTTVAGGSIMRSRSGTCRRTPRTFYPLLRLFLCP
jgi:hypothetical protein